MINIYTTKMFIPNNLIVNMGSVVEFVNLNSVNIYQMYDVNSPALTPLTANPTLEVLTNTSLTLTIPASSFNPEQMMLVDFNNQQRWYNIVSYEVKNENVVLHCECNYVWTVLIPLLYLQNNESAFMCERAHKNPWTYINGIPNIDVTKNAWLLNQNTPPAAIYKELPLEIINKSAGTPTLWNSFFFYKVDMYESTASSLTFETALNTIAYTPILGTDGETFWNTKNLLTYVINTTKGFLITPFSLQTIVQQPEQTLTGNTNVEPNVMSNTPGPTWQFTDLQLVFNTNYNNIQQTPYISPSSFWQGFGKPTSSPDSFLLNYFLQNSNNLTYTYLEPSLFLTSSYMLTYANASYPLTPFYNYYNDALQFMSPSNSQNGSYLGMALNNHFPNLELLFFGLTKTTENTNFNPSIPICTIPLNNEMTGLINSWTTYYNQNRLVASTMSKLKHLKDASVDLTQTTQVSDMLNPFHVLSSLFSKGLIGTASSFSNEMVKDSIERTSINLDYSNTYGRDAKYRMNRQAVMTGGGNNLSGYATLSPSSLLFFTHQPSLYDVAKYLSNIYTYGYELNYEMKVSDIWKLGWELFCFVKGELLNVPSNVLPQDFEHLKNMFKSGFWIVSQIDTIPSFNFLQFLTNPTQEQWGQYIANYILNTPNPQNSN